MTTGRYVCTMYKYIDDFQTCLVPPNDGHRFWGRGPKLRQDRKEICCRKQPLCGRHPESNKIETNLFIVDHGTFDTILVGQRHSKVGIYDLLEELPSLKIGWLGKLSHCAELYSSTGN